MAIAKRCKFCGKRLDAKGYCQNEQCPDYERTKELEDDDAGVGREVREAD